MTNILQKATYLLLLTIPFVMLQGCGNSNNTKEDTSYINVVCDGSIENVMNQEIEAYSALYPDVKIKGYYADTESIIDSLMDSKTKIIISPVPLTKEQENSLKSKNINPRTELLAMDGIALIVNKKNAEGPLFLHEIVSILTGEVDKWADLAPSKLGKIDLIFDKNGLSTYKYMEDSILKGRKFKDDVIFKNTPAEVIKEVEQNENALGVVSISWLAKDKTYSKMSKEDQINSLNMQDTVATDIKFDDNVKVLSVRKNDNIDAYAPYSAYMFNGEYILIRKIYAITTSPVGSPTNRFYNFILQKGQKILVKNGMVPAVNYR